MRFWSLQVFLVALFGAGAARAEPARVATVRVPHGGIQPQVAVDARGVVHVVYFQGDPRNGDAFYVRSEKGDERFSAPLRVNSQPGSVIAVGTIRGAQLALGKNGRVHVAWNGSGKAEPKVGGKEVPLLYARLNDSGTAFEPQRNLIQHAPGLDGGGSVAADAAGNVYVVWHAPAPGVHGEEHRCVWVTHSPDEGKTFAREQQANPGPTGACGCCGLKAFCDTKGSVHVLYRSAGEKIHRDIYLLRSAGTGPFSGEKLHAWQVDRCPMSSEAFAEGPGGVVAAWETDGQVYFSRLGSAAGRRADPVPAPGKGGARKHPAVAVNARGETLMAWTEGTGWNRGGALAWQVFDNQGQPTGDHGRLPGIPVWGLAAAFARPDGGFTVVY